MLREASILPIMFLCGVTGGAGDSGNSVGSSVTGVTCNVGGGGCVPAGTGGSAGRSIIGVAGSGVGGKCSGTRLAQGYFTAYPGTPHFDSFPGSVVFWVLFLEIWEYMLSAVSGPQHQRPVVLCVELFVALDLHQYPFCLIRNSAENPAMGKRP